MKADNNIAEVMAGILNPSCMKKVAHDTSIRNAIINLDKAAHILDNMGLYVAAEVVTEIIERIPTAIKEAE